MGRGWGGGRCQKDKEITLVFRERNVNPTLNVFENFTLQYSYSHDCAWNSTHWKCIKRIGLRWESQKTWKLGKCLCESSLSTLCITRYSLIISLVVAVAFLHDLYYSKHSILGTVYYFAFLLSFIYCSPIQYF